MNPQKGTLSRRLPFRESLAIDKPRHCPSVPRSASDVMIFPWIRWGEPTPHISLQLVAYRQPQCFATWLSWKNDSRLDLFISLAIRCMISNAQSDTKLTYVTNRIYRGHPEHCRLMLGHLRGRR